MRLPTRFFSRFKAELVEGAFSFLWKKHARKLLAISRVITTSVRLHSALGYKSPLEFEMELKTKNGERKDSLVSTFS
jgi:hypothetical protein